MGFDIEIIIEEDSIAPELLCPICAGIIDSPVRTPCSHLFCQGCINVWFQRSKDCPQCRTCINTPNSATIDRLLKNIIGATRVKCLKYKDGCNWIGKLDDLQTHKCELCSCPNCPHKTECESKAKQIRELIAEGENKEQQIRELGEKIKGLEAVVISQRLRNPPSRPPSPSGVPAFGRWSSSSALPIPGSPTAATRSSGNLLSLFNRNPVISALTSATLSPPPSSSSPASTSVQSSLSSSSYPSPSSAPCLSPLSSTSSSAVSSRRPNQTMAAPPGMVCNHCEHSEPERYSYYRCTDCPGQHHKSKIDYHLCAPCFLVYPPVHVGRFSKVDQP